MRIYLIGIMGSGKTTLGKALAKNLAWKFVDTDEYIVTQSQKSINEIFEIEGEEAFRLLEKETIQLLSFRSKVVIATGGGLACFNGNMKWMLESGITIYLDVPAKVVAQRLLKEGIEKRPLIKGMAKGQLISTINEMIQKRRKFYQKAQYSIAIKAGDKVEDIVRIIGDKIKILK